MIPSLFPELFILASTPARAFPRTPRLAGSGRVVGKVPIAPSAPPTPGRGDDAGEFTPRTRSESVSRLFNIAVAILLIVVTLPLTIVIAVLIRFTSPGPVFYTQTRVGLDRRWNRTHSLYERRREDLGGEQFTIYKFRSMRVDAEVDGQAQWAVKDDPRVTPIGRFIRSTRIDELPQLVNVLRGEMNLIGPRPERPSIFVRLREQVENYSVRQRVRPGISGWAQVNRSYDTDIEGVREKVRLDIEYLRSQSIWMDLRILLRSVPVVLNRIGGW